MKGLRSLGAALAALVARGRRGLARSVAPVAAITTIIAPVITAIVTIVAPIVAPIAIRVRRSGVHRAGERGRREQQTKERSAHHSS